MRSGMNMKPSPNAKDVKEELKKQRDAKAKEVKDPEEELKKLFTFLGTDKKWSSETMPSSAGDGEARCPSEVSMIAGEFISPSLNMPDTYYLSRNQKAGAKER